MQGCMMSTEQQPVCTTKNLQRPFWQQFVLDERTPEHVYVLFLHVAWNNQNQTNVFVSFLTCMVHDFPKGNLRGRWNC